MPPRRPSCAVLPRQRPADLPDSLAAVLRCLERVEHERRDDLAALLAAPPAREGRRHPAATRQHAAAAAYRADALLLAGHPDAAQIAGRLAERLLRSALRLESAERLLAAGATRLA